MLDYFKKERNPLWKELFFDLSFAVLLGQVTHLLFSLDNGVIRLDTLLMFTVITLLLFNVWMSFTQFINFYGSTSPEKNLITVQYIIVFLLMTFLITIGIFMDSIYNNFNYIALSISSILFILGLGYLYHNKLLEGNSQYAKYKFVAYTSIFIITSLVFILDKDIAIIGYLSLILFERYILDDFLVPRTIKYANLSLGILVERIGIFMILIFGESILTIFNYRTSVYFSFDILPLVFISLLSIFAIFITYFTFLNEQEERNIKRASRILIPNSFIMFSMVVLPSIYYHAFNNVIHLDSFFIIYNIFLITYLVGFFLSYYPLIQRFSKNILVHLIINISFLVLVNLFVDSVRLATILLILLLIGTSIWVTIIHKLLHCKDKKKD